jgi:hypothetical protein
MDMSQVTSGVVSLAVLAISRFAIPWAKEKLGLEKMGKAQAIVDLAVAAAEQMATAGLLKKSGKKDHVIKFVTGQGVKLEKDYLDEMIEAAVFKLPKQLVGEILEVKKGEGSN